MPSTTPRNNLCAVAPTYPGVVVTITMGTTRPIPRVIMELASRVIQEDTREVLKERHEKIASYPAHVRLGDGHYVEVQGILSETERLVVRRILDVWMTPEVPVRAQRVRGPICGAPMYAGDVATPMCCEPPGHYPETPHRGNGSYADTTWEDI